MNWCLHWWWLLSMHLWSNVHCVVWPTLSRSRAEGCSKTPLVHWSASKKHLLSLVQVLLNLSALLSGFNILKDLNRCRLQKSTVRQRRNYFCDFMHLILIILSKIVVVQTLLPPRPVLCPSGKTRNSELLPLGLGAACRTAATHWCRG